MLSCGVDVSPHAPAQSGCHATPLTVSPNGAPWYSIFGTAFYVLLANGYPDGSGGLPWLKFRFSSRPK